MTEKEIEIQKALGLTKTYILTCDSKYADGDFIAIIRNLPVHVSPVDILKDFFTNRLFTGLNIHNCVYIPSMQEDAYFKYVDHQPFAVDYTQKIHQYLKEIQ